MQLFYYLFFIAFSLAISSTYCTIKGISQVFEANIVAITIITAVLEAGKYCSMFTLTKRWNDKSYGRFKYVLACLVCFMTILSSAGIFSFYATSYSRSVKPISSYTVQLDGINNKIEYSKEIIERTKQQQDNINSTIARYIEMDRLRQSQDIRKQNQKELQRLDSIISEELDKLNSLNEEKIKITQEISKVKQESGFITNVASTLHIDLSTDPDGEFKVVLLIIAIILLAMEPLSLFSMVMGQLEYKKYKDSIKENTGANIKALPSIINEKVQDVGCDIEKEIKHWDTKFFGESTCESKTTKVNFDEKDFIKQPIYINNVDTNSVNKLEKENSYTEVNAEIDGERKPNTIEVNEIKTSMD